MGWLILVLVIFIVAFIVTIKTDDYRYQGIQIASGSIAFVSVLGIFIITCFLLDTKPNEKATILKYENLKTICNDLGVPSETTLKEIVSMNKKICDHKVYANDFMTKGLYSKKVGKLPLLEIPEIMKVSPIDYE